jgi:shikimate dehydrogenase
MTAPVTVCGSISLHPVSLGARMHSAGYQALGLSFVYAPFAVREEDVEGALRGVRALGIRGVGVSMPFKVQVMPLLDHIDDLASRIGAVNTIVNDAGVLMGYNTDAWGASRALQEVTTLPGKQALVIGAGGAARAVVHAFMQAGMAVHIVNRTRDKAAALASHVGGHHPEARVTHGGLDDLRDLSGFQVLVNCSSAGMDGYGPSPVPLESVHPDLVVMDIVYKPIRTQLLREAEARGARTVHGGRMLLHQACRQFELYTGRPAPMDAMDAALRTAI